MRKPPREELYPIAPTAKFCPECGHPVSVAPAPQTRFASSETCTPKHLAERILTSKAALEGERKQVTVLFADMKGSMELLADRDPEDARKPLDPLLELMMSAVHHYDGTVNQVMGDRHHGALRRAACPTKTTRCGPATPHRRFVQAVLRTSSTSRSRRVTSRMTSAWLPRSTMPILTRAESSRVTCSR